MFCLIMLPNIGIDNKNLSLISLPVSVKVKIHVEIKLKMSIKNTEKSYFWNQTDKLTNKTV